MPCCERQQETRDGVGKFGNPTMAPDSKLRNNWVFLGEEGDVREENCSQGYES